MGRKSVDGLPPGIHKDQHGAFWATLEGGDAKQWKERYPGRTVPRRKAATLKAARDLQRQLIKDLTTGRDSQADNPKVGDYVAEWIRAKANLTKSTRLRYTQLHKHQIQPFTLARLRLRQIDHNQEAVQRWIAELQAHPRKEQPGAPERTPRLLDAYTIRNAYAVVRAALNVAEQRNLIAKNPCRRGVTLPQTEDEEIHPLTPEQTQTLFSVLAQWDKDGPHRMQALYHIAIRCGPRQGEMIGLRISDLDMKRRELHIRGQIQLRERTPTKGKRARTVMLADDMIAMLRTHLAQLAEERTLCGDGWNAERLLFCSENGTQLDPSNLSRQYEGILHRAQLPVIRFHDLRHTYAALSIAAGVDIYTLSRLMGHSSITVTANRYGHLYDETKQHAADQMDRLLRKVP